MPRFIAGEVALTSLTLAGLPSAALRWPLAMAALMTCSMWPRSLTPVAITSAVAQASMTATTCSTRMSSSGMDPITG